MGDRGNIVMKYENGERIYFYTHWRGYDIHQTLAEALEKGKESGRLDDTAYLSRIVFCTLLNGDIDGTTGYGITPYLCDNEHNLLEVDIANHIVHEKTEDGKLVTPLTFMEFIQRYLTTEEPKG